MKPLKLFNSISAILVIASCNVSPIEPDSSDGEIKRVTTDVTAFQDVNESVEVKSAVVKNSTGYHFVWSQEDSIGIFPSAGYQVAFSMKNGAGSSSAVFDGGGWALKKSSYYSAYFPLIGEFYLDKTKIPMSVTGQRQSANGSYDHIGKYDHLTSINAKALATSSLDLNFKHDICVLHFKLKLPAGTYSAFTISSDEKFDTRRTINLNNGAVTTLDRSEVLSLDLDDISISSGGVLETFIAVFPHDFTGHKIRLTAYDSDGIPYSVSIDGTNYAAGNFYNYSEREASYDWAVQAMTDYMPYSDTLRVLENPHKGWYHHYYSNSLDKYGLTSEEDNLIKTFPGMDHIYIRLAWSYFEPSEGKYDWHLIDDILDKYSKMGYGVAFRITCRETGSVGQFKNGCYYATPYWVKQAGVPGVEIKDAGNYSSWSPDYSNSTFLKKLENFHKAFAARYDGNPLVRYIDVGSMGDWGEGHTSFSTNEMIPDDVVKKHFDIYKRCYKQTPVVMMDNSISYQRGDEPYVEGYPKSESIVGLMNYAYDLGFGVRYDSFLVDWHLKRDAGGVFHWAVNRPYIFERFYQDRLVVHEEDHYAAIKDAGNWKGLNGQTPLDLVGSFTGAVYHTSGYEIFMRSMEITHPTYIGYHGKLKEWLSENPDLAKYAANKCGYWLAPVSSYIDNETLSVTWRNNGVAPCYHKYQLRLHFVDESGSDTVQIIDDSGNRSWLPGMDYQCEYTVDYPRSLMGKTFHIYMQLYDVETDKPIDIALDKNYVGNSSMIPLF